MWWYPYKMLISERRNATDRLVRHSDLLSWDMFTIETPIRLFGLENVIKIPSIYRSNKALIAVQLIYGSPKWMAFGCQHYFQIIYFTKRIFADLGYVIDEILLLPIQINIIPLCFGYIQFGVSLTRLLTQGNGILCILNVNIFANNLFSPNWIFFGFWICDRRYYSAFCDVKHIIY
jgi:hypothetical protein